MALSEIKITSELCVLWNIFLELTHFNSLWTSELNLAQEAWPKKKRTGSL